MQRYLTTGLLATAVLASATPISAGHHGILPAIERFARNFWWDYRENQLWPEPYVQPDRQAVRTPMELIIAKGWKRQNTLNDHHFEEGSTELTEAGRLKVKWILINVSPQFRSVFVERGVDPEVTSARIASVQQVASDYVIDGEMPPVVATSGSAEGWPAVDIDHVRRKYLDSAPEPRLPGGLQGTGGF